MLSTKIVEFCARLRGDLHFIVGHAEALDALRAAEVVGIGDPSRLCSALQVTLCSRPEEIEVFDEAFAAFFMRPGRGAAQPLYAPRHSRPQADAQQSNEFYRSKATGKHDETTGETADGIHAFGEVRSAAAGSVAAATHPALRARYSPESGTTEPPAITSAGVQALLGPADHLVASTRLGRLRRWKPEASGSRFDVRRTLRAGLHTGGDLVALRFLGHPLRNPRFVILIDGSRSMATHGSVMLEFACALVRRSARTNVFLFSTQLHDVTLALRRSRRQREFRFGDVGEAWGGGTRIGSSLSEFVRLYGRLLGDETVVIMYSDGLDAGDTSQLERAMREIHRRSVGVIWVNPLAGTPGYAPLARGMSVCLPFIDAFVGARDAAGLASLARHAAAVAR